MDEERAHAIMRTGQKLQRFGCVMTMLFTVPLVLAVIFGVGGLVVGVILFVVFMIAFTRSTG